MGKTRMVNIDKDRFKEILKKKGITQKSFASL